MTQTPQEWLCYSHFDPISGKRGLNPATIASLYEQRKYHIARQPFNLILPQGENLFPDVEMTHARYAWRLEA
jgi:hypothetical protein